MSEEVEEIREKMDERREEELVKRSLELRDVSPEETFKTASDLSSFVMKLNKKGENSVRRRKKS